MMLVLGMSELLLLLLLLLAFPYIFAILANAGKNFCTHTQLLPATRLLLLLLPMIDGGSGGGGGNSSKDVV